jgi:hypothetical protein
VTDRVVEKRLQAKQFLPELDESMDTWNKAQMVAFVWVPEAVWTVEQVLFCGSLEGNATGRTISEVMNDFVNKHKIK